MAKAEDVLNGSLTWSKLIAFAILIFGGMFSSAMLKDSVAPSAPDRFTGTDAKLMRLEILNEANERIDALERQMPPEPTRERIRHNERAIRKLDPTFVPATDKWR